MARMPSHFISYAQPLPSGTIAPAASIGEIGSGNIITGYPRHPRRSRTTFV